MSHFAIAPTDIVVDYTLIPTQKNEPFYDEIVSIDGSTYVFTFRWSQLEGYWYLDVAEETGVSIITGIRLVLGITLGRTSVHRLFRSGVMLLIDTTDSDANPGFADLGTRVELRRFTNDQYLAAFGIKRTLVPS